MHDQLGEGDQANFKTALCDGFSNQKKTDCEQRARSSRSAENAGELLNWFGQPQTCCSPDKRRKGRNQHRVRDHRKNDLADYFEDLGLFLS